jgi:hypothetical protein
MSRERTDNAEVDQQYADAPQIILLHPAPPPGLPSLWIQPRPLPRAVDSDPKEAVALTPLRSRARGEPFVRADLPCIASATYTPLCGCKTKVVIRRGEMPPVCPLCRKVVDWTFLTSVYIDEVLKAARDSGPSDPPTPHRV